MYLNNVKYRADTGRCMATYVRTERKTSQKFYDFAMDPNNSEGINAALRHPQSVDAKRILNVIAPFILQVERYHIHLWKEEPELQPKYLPCVAI